VTVLERHVRFVVAHAWPVLLGVVLVTAALGAGVGRLRTDFDVEAMLPAAHRFVQVDRAIRREFGGRNTIVVAIVPREGSVWRPEVLEVVRDATLEALRLPDVMAHAVVSLAAPAVRHAEDAGGMIRVDYLMREVPRTPAEVAVLRARVEGDPHLAGFLVTPDERAALLVLDFWDGPEGPDLAARVQDLARGFADRPVDFYFAGGPIASLVDLEQAAEVAARVPLVFGAIAVVLLFAFRNLQGMVVPLLTAALSTAWALGLMGHQGLVIDSWNVAVPILIIAIAAGHSAQMLKRYTEEVARLGDNRAAVLAATVAIAPVMVAAGLTAALGFASLALFGVPSIARFGLSCAYGIVSAVVLELTFIPALRALLPRPRRLPAQGGATGHVIRSLERGILRRGGAWVLAGTALALALAAAGAARIHTFGSTRIYMPADSLARRHLEVIERHFPGVFNMTILYEGAPGTTRNARVLTHMAALQEALARDPLVLRTASLADLVKALHRTFNPEDPVPYRVPDDQELVAQLMFLGDSPAFERFTDRALSKGLVVAYLRDDDSARVGPLVRHAEAWLAAHPPPEGVRVLVAGGAGPTVLAVNEHTTYGKLLNMLVVLVAIYAVASVVLRSPVGGLYVVMPIVVSIVMLFGVLGWTGIRLDMGSSSIIAMAAGVGADYAIYFLYRLREERARVASDGETVAVALETSGRAVLFVAASIAAGFLVTAASRFHGLRLFGTLMPVAMVVSCLAALSIMPVAVLRLRPRFVFGGDGEPAASAPLAPVPVAPAGERDDR
jgi:predicted RND superfamily exporter protein